MGCFWKVSAEEMLALTAKLSQERVHAPRCLFSVPGTENRSKVVIFRKAGLSLKIYFCWFGHVIYCNHFKEGEVWG